MAARKREEQETPVEEHAPEELDNQLAAEVAKTAEGESEAPAQGPAPDEYEITIDDEEPEDDEEPKPTRKDKKRERGKLLEAKEKAEREAQELRERVARLEGNMSSFSRQPPPQDRRSDPLEDAIEEHKREARQFHNWVNSKTNWTPEEQKEAEDKAWELRLREGELAAARAQRRMAPSPDMARKQALAQQVQIRYPDVFSSPKRDQILRLATAYEAQEVALGKHASWELLDDAMKRAKIQLGAESPPAPSSAQKRRYTSQPRRAGTSGSGQRTVRLSKVDRQMALEMYRPSLQDGSMTEQQAMKQYFKEVLEPQERGG